jgi:3-oxoacyl-[acyl-carrier-protein] synthase II
MAEELMANDALDYCLVVGTEEIDWLLCDAYRRWRLLRSAPPIEVFRNQKRGMILSEGAGAIVLARNGFVAIERAHPGGYFVKRSEAASILKRMLCDLSQIEIDFVISSANGTFVDHAESQALEEVLPNSVVYTGKPALGESVGAAGLWQIILAAEALRSKEIPPVLHADHNGRLRLSVSRTPVASARRAIVLSSGLNQQTAGLRLAVE